MAGIEARSVNRLYLLDREICVGQDQNDAISRCYGLGPAGTGGRLENPGDGPEADGRDQHRSGNCKTNVFAHGSLLPPRRSPRIYVGSEPVGVMEITCRAFLGAPIRRPCKTTAESDDDGEYWKVSVIAGRSFY